MDAHDLSYDYSYDYYYNYSDSLGNANLSFSLDCPDSRLRGSSVFIPVAYYLFFFTGFLGNLFVIGVVGSKSRRRRRLVDTFIVNLALADLVFVFTLPLWAASGGRGGRWDFGNILCKLSSYVIAVNRFSNIAFLTCMSVDRYLAVVKLMDSRHLRSGRCVHVTCAVVWLSSLVVGLPSWVYREVMPTDDGAVCLENNSSTSFLALSLTMTLLTFVAPVFIITLCYGRIVLHLSKHCLSTVNPRAEARRRHTVKMVLAIVVAFVVSWLPFNIFKTIIIVASRLSAADRSCGAPPWQRDGLLVSCCLAFLNSCVNPAIYVFLDQHFRARAAILYRACTGAPKAKKSRDSSASVTNAETSESVGTTGGGRTQQQGSD